MDVCLAFIGIPEYIRKALCTKNPKMTLALLNGIRAPAVESQPSLCDSGSGTLIQPQLQTWTHFNGTLCNLETAIEC